MSTKQIHREQKSKDYSKPMLQEAVDAVLQSFAKHTKCSNEVDAIETLQEFWKMKTNQYGVASKRLTYDVKLLPDRSFVSYVMLPGGSCFGNFQHCTNETEASLSAAKIALMNSVFNEHPSRLITDSFIEQAVIEAKTSNKMPDDKNGIDTYKFMLMQNKGRSMLEFQELMTIFRLLYWDGTLDKLQQRNLRRDEVVLYYLNKELDNSMRDEMAEQWCVRERENPGILNAEITKVGSELEEFRLAGRELRFFKEKMDILTLAVNRSRML